MTEPQQRTERSPEELRADLGELRAELGETVDELAARADVPARARQKKDEAVERVQEQVARAREVVERKAPALENPTVLAGIAAALVAVLLWRRRRGPGAGRGGARGLSTPSRVHSRP